MATSFFSYCIGHNEYFARISPVAQDVIVLNLVCSEVSLVFPSELACVSKCVNDGNILHNYFLMKNDKTTCLVCNVTGNNGLQNYDDGEWKLYQIHCE